MKKDDKEEIEHNKEELILKLLDSNPEYKLLFFYDNSKLSNPKKLNNSNDVRSSSSLFNFIYENGISSGRNFKDILFFSLYNNLGLQSTHNNNSFFDVLRNLKMLVNINQSKKLDELPIFYYKTIYKSILYLNKSILDLKGCSSIVDRLEEILDFFPIFISELKIHQQLVEEKEKNRNNHILIDEDLEIELDNDKSLIKHIISQIEIFYSILIQHNANNKFNREQIHFYLKHINPLLNGDSAIYMNLFSDKIADKPSLEKEQINDMLVKKEILNENSNKAKLNEDKICLKSQISVSHKQNLQSDKNIKKVSNSRVVHNQVNIYQEIVLTNKVKNFSENHFTRQKFQEKFLKQNLINENDLHQMLQSVAYDYFENEGSIGKIKYEKIEIEILRQEFNTFCKNTREIEISLEIIGSCSLNTLTNMRNKTEVDLLLLPAPDSKLSYAKIIKNLKNINEIIKMFISYNDEEKANYKFTIEKLRKEHLLNFCFGCQLRMNRSDESNLIKVFLFDEKWKLSNTILKQIFNPVNQTTNLQVLHIFFQEILITKVEVVYYRSDVSLLILAFLDYHYQLFDKGKKTNTACKVLDHDSNSIEKEVKLKKLDIIENAVYYFEIDKNRLDAIFSTNVGELIIEFFRYIINFIVYLKAKFYKSSPKGWEVLKQIFEEEYLRDENYIFNISFMYEHLNITQEEFNKQIFPRLTNLEGIFFKICENFDKITHYKHITSNIG